MRILHLQSYNIKSILGVREYDDDSDNVDRYDDNVQYDVTDWNSNYNKSEKLKCY